MLDDELRDVFDGAHFRVHQEVGLPIERVAFRQELANARLRIRRLKQGPVRLVADPLPERFRRGPEADDEGVPLETDQVVRIRRQPAARGNHEAAPVLELAHHLPLTGAKGGFSILGKNAGNGLAGPGFDQSVSVQELKVELRGRESPDRRLADAHEADEGQVVHQARVVHRLGVTDRAGWGTQFLERLHENFVSKARSGR